AGDADLGHDVRGDDVLGGGDGGDPGRRVNETALPEQAVVGRAAGPGVGVEGVDAVVLGGGEDDVERALAGDGEVGLVERLGVDVAVRRITEQLAEVGRVDVGGRQHRLLRVGPGDQPVVVGAEHIDVGGRQA